MRDVLLTVAATTLLGVCGPDLPDGASCEVADLPLEWPFAGVEGVDWVVNNYVDLQSGPSTRDYRGGPYTYEGHTGVDIDVPNFRWMDADFPVLAAAPGEVVEVRDGNFDRNMSCTGSWNGVVIQHANGFVTRYGHLKKHSVQVSVGDWVTAGQALGVVGSSGCSTQAHLHFEVGDCDRAVRSPFAEGMFVQAPDYSPPLQVMDLSLHAGGTSTLEELKDPPANATVTAAGTMMGLGLSLSGSEYGDELEVSWLDPTGVERAVSTLGVGGGPRHRYQAYNEWVDTPGAGWRIEISVNGQLAREIGFAVQP